MVPQVDFLAPHGARAHTLENTGLGDGSTKPASHLQTHAVLTTYHTPTQCECGRMQNMQAHDYYYCYV